MKSLRQRAIDGLQKGDTFAASRTFCAQDIEQFAQISRDYNPVHVDPPFARLRNFNAPVCHGLLTASLVTEIGGQIGWLASGMNLRFTRPVYVGETITCQWTITDLDERGRARAQVRITNPQGVIVLEAEMAGVIPGQAQRARLAEMVAEGDPTNRVLRRDTLAAPFP